MKIKIFVITFFAILFLNGQKTNYAQSVPVTEEYFGIKITDEYRNLEEPTG